MEAKINKGRKRIESTCSQVRIFRCYIGRSGFVGL